MTSDFYNTNKSHKAKFSKYLIINKMLIRRYYKLKKRILFYYVTQ